MMMTGNKGLDLFKLSESRPAIRVRHIEVEQDQVRLVSDGARDGFDAIARFIHLVALGLQHGGQAAAHHRIVVGNQNMIVNWWSCPCQHCGTRHWRAGIIPFGDSGIFHRNPQHIAHDFHKLPEVVAAILSCG
jgi:hypothetical protein